MPSYFIRFKDGSLHYKRGIGHSTVFREEAALYHSIEDAKRIDGNCKRSMLSSARPSRAVWSFNIDPSNRQDSREIQFSLHIRRTI